MKAMTLWTIDFLNRTCAALRVVSNTSTLRFCVWPMVEAVRVVNRLLARAVLEASMAVDGNVITKGAKSTLLRVDCVEPMVEDAVAKCQIV